MPRIVSMVAESVGIVRMYWPVWQRSRGAVQIGACDGRTMPGDRLVRDRNSGDDFTERERLRLVRRGDEAAIRQFVETYQQSVYTLCYRMLGEAGEAEDATQEVLFKALTRFHQYDATRPLKPWLLRIASNECIDRLRRRKPTVSLDGMGEDGAWEWQPGRSPSPEEAFLKREQQESVQALLTVLQPTDRMLVTLFYWEGLSYEEIRRVTGLTISAIKSRLFRARRTMAQALAEAGHGG